MAGACPRRTASITPPTNASRLCISVGHSILRVGHIIISVGHTIIKVGHTNISVGHSIIKVGHTSISVGNTVIKVASYLPLGGRCLDEENSLDHSSNKFVAALEASLKDA